MADEDVVGRALTFIKTNKYQYVKFFSDVILIFFDLASRFLSKWHVNCSLDSGSSRFQLIFFLKETGHGGSITLICKRNLTFLIFPVTFHHLAFIIHQQK
jgi:hypothetical protein